MTINDYYTYQRQSRTSDQKYPIDNKGFIKFAVNIDIEHWDEEMEELRRKVPDLLRFDSDKDAMQYLKQKIKGVNLPQVYLKVDGAWTGGHEEHSRLRAINFNHGPEGCYWYTIHVKYATMVR
mmetsp:Transcript_29704/g.27170  ORF Transcript_29704/g.27170 Transcript_29704/m.27170 type:complete len:123 (-) Transcript_29704:132-500(-)